MENKLKIGILYICTGYYDVFFPKFYESSERFFLPDCEKTYYVFTDSEKEYFNRENIVKIYQQDIGWPDNTLKRFHMFDRITDRLEKCDYLFFFNSNMEFMMPVQKNILPNKGLIAVQHPGYYKSTNLQFTYDRNPNCMAYIPHGEGMYYVCGGVNGGTSEEYIIMYKELKRRIDIDERNGIIALWHDESHWNKYVWENDNVTILGPEYCYPDLYDLPGRIQIIRLIWKQAVLKVDVWKLRGEKVSLQKRIYEYKSKKKIRIYMAKREEERIKFLSEHSEENKNA